jgi:hypothetical protein
MALGIPRSAEFDALYALMKQAYAWKSTFNSARVFQDTQRFDMPAAVLWIPAESHTRSQQNANLPIRTRKYKLSVYMRDQPTYDEANPVQHLIDDVLDGIDNAIYKLTPLGVAKDPGWPQTLIYTGYPNGTCTDVWVDGESPINAAIIDQSVVFHVPIFVRTGR